MMDNTYYVEVLKNIRSYFLSLIFFEKINTNSINTINISIAIIISNAESEKYDLIFFKTST